ncbi:hypothetical protein [Riemerella columbina]|uniref:hypothetical protein n=1 Tax=Riemerella columbina TaxID=103810 RepID=UPI0026708BB6|nr:hypothetical protein [Riemerella columbina]WKS95587.1 hypothetical protein NYR17_02275 [Riemerella columbina]
MLNIDQIIQIKNYLKYKKVSRLMLNEITDHFSQEITTQMEAGQSFQEAFLYTKIKWQDDLSPVRIDSLFPKKVPKIEVDSIKMLLNQILGRALCIAALLILVTRYYQWDWLSMVIVGVWGLMLLYALIFEKIKLFTLIELNVNPLVLRTVFVSLLISFVAYYSSFYTYYGFLKYWVRDFFFILNAMIQMQLLFYLIRKNKIQL